MDRRITTGILLLCGSIGAQDAGLKYEVASVKSTPPGARGGTARPEPGGKRYRGTNLPLRLYILSAYQLKADQLQGEPGWADTDRFDIEAQAEKPSSLAEHRQMMKNLLAERFHLRFHFDTKEMPLYALTVDKTGAKLEPHTATNSGDSWIEQGMDRPFHARWKGAAAPMELLAFRLSQVVDRPVVDETGLKGDYDFTLTWTTDLPPNLPPNALLNGEPIDTTGPNIFQALRQELGLRLDVRKGPVPIMTVDRVEKPSEN